MSQQDPQAQSRRNRLVGRLIIIAFGLLLLVYFVPLALSFFNHR